MENTEQRGTGNENGSEWSNGTVHFDRTGPTENSGPNRQVDRFLRNFSGWVEPIHSVESTVRSIVWGMRLASQNPYPIDNQNLQFPHPSFDLKK